MAISETEFQEIVKFFKDRYGVNLKEKRALIEGRLASVMMKGNYATYSDFMQKVTQNPFGEEATTLVNSLTTNHTFFLRESVHFDFLKNVALPELKAKNASKKDLGIWSAAASSGEEAFTISMVLKDFFKLEFQNWDTTILATDVSRKALSIGAAGIYDEERVKDIPADWLSHNFDRTPDGRYAIKKELKDRVLFRYFNLMEQFPFKRKFDIVFLRNVMIYFDEETKVKLLKKIYDVMEPGGYLFIGCTEIIDKTKSDFQSVQPSIYRR